MKAKFVLSVLVLTTVSVLAQPRIFIENTVFDWGTTPEGNDRLRHSFIVVNRGTDTLRITNIRSSCGCTVPKYDSIVAPGRTGNITAEFNKAGRTGHQTSNLTVFTNDPESEHVRLTLRGHIRTPLDVSPRWLNLFSERGKVSGRVSFVTGNNNLTINKAQYVLSNDNEKLVPSNLTMTLVNKSAPDQNGDITYEFDFSFARNVDRYENGTITFETNVKEKPSVSMNVSVEPSRGAPY